MKRLFKKLANTNISTAYIFILLGISTLMMAGYFSYAWFTVQGVQKYSVVTGNLYGTVAIGTNSVTIAGQGVLTYTPTTDSDTITLTVTNTNDRTVKNSIYYYNLSDSTIQIGYTSDSPTIPSTTGVSVNQNKTLTYKIKIKNAKGKQIKIGSSMGLSNSNLTLPSGTTAFALLSEPPAAETLIAKANPETLDYNNATADQKNQMWAFSHEATEQLGATTDYRYIGANPNNYVKFNDELWRIIGVFDVYNGKKVEKRVKIIKNETIGGYTWDVKSDCSYKNDWSAAQLRVLLNIGAYYQRTTGIHYITCMSAITPDFTSTGLTSEAQEIIENAKWYLGGAESFSSPSNGSASHWYKYERGTTVYSGSSTNWTGKVGLIYPSDYGYATSGGNTVNRESCMATGIYYWNSSSYDDCKNNDWLFKSNTMWTISPSPSISDYVFYVNYGGSIEYDYVHRTFNVFPTVYLKSTIKITGGTGSSTDPFILG